MSNVISLKKREPVHKAIEWDDPMETAGDLSLSVVYQSTRHTRLAFLEDASRLMGVQVSGEFLPLNLYGGTKLKITWTDQRYCVPRALVTDSYEYLVVSRPYPDSSEFTVTVMDKDKLQAQYRTFVEMDDED